MRFSKSIKQLFNYNLIANFIIINREKSSFIIYKFLKKIKREYMNIKYNKSFHYDYAIKYIFRANKKYNTKNEKLFEPM